jgi:hypothetical protein
MTMRLKNYLIGIINFLSEMNQNVILQNVEDVAIMAIIITFPQ